MTFDIASEWEKVWAESLSNQLKRSEIPAKEWRVAGRISKANPDKENLAWWKTHGLEQVEEYVRWMAKTGWSIAKMPDGRPGIEWSGEVEFGGVPVKLIIDAIYSNGTDLIVVDYKTGSRDPKGFLQLGLYASAIEKICGVRPKWGGYYMTRKASLSSLVDLSPWSIDFFDYQASAMIAYRDTGFYPANVGDACNICSFSDYCVAAGGTKAKDFPLIQITNKEKV